MAATFVTPAIMWKQIALFTLKFRLPILVTLSAITIVLAYLGLRLPLSYDLRSAVSEDSEIYKTHQAFKAYFGEDNNTVVLGFNKADPDAPFLRSLSKFCTQLKATSGIAEVLALPQAVNIYKVQTDTQSTLSSKPIFGDSTKSIDSAYAEFYNLPFYQGLLYNPSTGAQLIALKIDANIIKTKARTVVVQKIIDAGNKFAAENNLQIKYSGLPLIRSVMAKDIQREMRIFLLLSLLLTAVVLFLFFRDIVTALCSLLIVVACVAWSTGIMYLLGYKITMLTALIPPLIVVIGIPNCIYFLNKYHQEFSKGNSQAKSLVSMVQRMGVVTLFTNITAAIGFGVFCLTGSTVLQEFGWVAWLGIMSVFFVSLLGIPALFSYLKPPSSKNTNYLDAPLISKFLVWNQNLVANKRKALYLFWIAVTVLSSIGLLKLKEHAYMVDDLPKQSTLMQDLKYFEQQFGGVMPLEIWIDTKKKNGAIGLGTITKIDELSQALAAMDSMGKPLSFVEAVKFARQAYYDGDSTSYAVPSSLDASFLQPYLRTKNNAAGKNYFSKLMLSFVDSNKQHARITVNMADVGSNHLPKIIDSVKQVANEIFDTSRYNIKYTGASIVFLEGSKYIIASLRDSIIYAFVMIIVCMVLLFRSWRIVAMAMLANIIPLIITAGLMGWLGVPLKPSTVLVFSIALGITVDVTIRFLVAYKQLLPKNNFNIAQAALESIKDTGLSIVYTSLILIVGFMVFSISNFGGTKALGLLTSFTLLLAMFINLSIVPALLMWMDKVMSKKRETGLLEEALAEEEVIDKK